jgi:hypothetical protein
LAWSSVDALLVHKPDAQAKESYSLPSLSRQACVHATRILGWLRYAERIKRVKQNAAMSLLVDKARLMLSRRINRPTVASYLKQYGARHLAYSALFWVLILLAWWNEQQPVALVVVGFWAGRLMRDIQWYQRLVAEWDSTSELIDWQKVEMLAARPTSMPPSISS